MNLKASEFGSSIQQQSIFNTCTNQITGNQELHGTEKNRQLDQVHLSRVVELKKLTGFVLN